MAYDDPTAKALRQVFGSEGDAALRNQFLYIVSGVPIVGDIARSYDNWSFLNDYMENRGISWADVKYPTRLGSTYSAVPAFVSSNIERLYR